MKKILLLVLCSAVLHTIAKAQYRFDTFDIDPGSAHSYPGDLISFNDKVYFYAHQANSQGLWSTDKYNAPTNTGLITPNTYLYHASNNTYRHVAIAAGKLFFSMGDMSRKKLAIYDGINPVYIADSAAWVNMGTPEFITPLNNIIYFSAYDGDSVELYSYDPVTDKISIHSNFNNHGADNIWNMTAFKGKLYFYAAYTGINYELHEYTPGNAAPVLVADINPGIAGGMPAALHVYKDKMYFSATTATTGRELYSYDGVNPPRMIADLNPGTAAGCLSVEQNGIFGYKNYIYFNGNNGITGQELYRYDMAADTIGLAYAFVSGYSTDAPRQFTIFGDKLVFHTDSGIRQNFRLWSYNGSSAPMQIATPAVSQSWPTSYYTVLDSQLYFCAIGTGLGTEVFSITDSNFTPLPADTTTPPDTPTHITTLSLKGKVIAYPNPTHSSTTLEVSLHDAQSFAITLTDVYGRTVHTIAKKQYNAGKHNITIPMQALPAGIYYYRIANGSEQLATGKVMKE